MTMHPILLTAAFALALGTVPARANEPAPTDAASDWQGLHFGISAARPYGDNFWFFGSALDKETAPADWSGNLSTLSDRKSVV